MTKECIACGMLMTAAEDFPGRNIKQDYCLYCAKPDGSMQSYEEKLAGYSAWLKRTQGLEEHAALAQSELILSQLPVWKHLNKQSLKWTGKNIGRERTLIDKLGDLTFAGDGILAPRDTREPKAGIFTSEHNGFYISTIAKETGGLMSGTDIPGAPLFRCHSTQAVQNKTGSPERHNADTSSAPHPSTAADFSATQTCLKAREAA